MADSYRLQVLKALTTLLEATVVTPVAGITPAMPATLDGLVFRGRARFGENDPPTMVAILEAPRPAGANYAGDYEARNELWQLLVQGWCPDDKVNPSDPIYSLLDDVERQLDRVMAITTAGMPKDRDNYMLGNLVSTFRVGQPVVRPPTPDVSSKSFFYVPVQVGLARTAS